MYSWGSNIYLLAGKSDLYSENLILVISSKRLSSVIKRLDITWMLCYSTVCMPGFKPNHGL